MKTNSDIKISLNKIKAQLESVNEPNRSACLKILDILSQEPYASSPGSKHNHQTWPGGYLSHVAEVIMIAKVMYASLSFIRNFPFTLSDAVFILFLHDLEKPFKYGEGLLIQKQENYSFKLSKIKEFGIDLTDDQLNALKYVEGENDDYKPGQRVMNPLAAFCHMCDICSARIWFDCPNYGL